MLDKSSWWLNAAETRKLHIFVNKPQLLVNDILVHISATSQLRGGHTQI